MAKLRVDKIAAPIVKDEFTGSVYFDGNGDYLSIPTSTDFALGTNDWTVEWFAYPTSTTEYQRHFYLEGSSSSNIDGVFANSSGIAFGRTGVWASSAATNPLNQWNHYALVHDSTNMRLYINGVQVLTDSNNFGTDSTKTLNIGYSNSTFGGYFTGNISNFRILKGVALYTANFTSPQIPDRELEVLDDRTVFLACQSPTDATAEATGRHTITAVGNAHAQSANPGLPRRIGGTLNLTTVTENTGSVYFDGSGDALRSSPYDELTLGTGAFTVECWFWRQNITDSWGSLVSDNLYSGAGGWDLYTQYNDIRFYVGGVGEVFTVSDCYSAQTWTHVAAQRDSAGNMSCYINGVNQNVSASNSTDYTDNRILIGGNNSPAGSYPNYVFNGYISNVRVCRGHTVYTSNFAVPTRELEVHPGPSNDKTIFLACYDGENVFAEKTGKIIAANGDRLSSPTPTATDSPIGITTHNPGLTRNVDPTAGPTFQGGAGYASQNWLTLPKGTTTERFVEVANNAVSASSARGINGGGYVAPNNTNIMQYITIATTGDAKDFGDLSVIRNSPGAVASSTRGIWMGGVGPSPGNTALNTIDYVTISTLGNAADFGDLIVNHRADSAAGNSTRGLRLGQQQTPAVGNTIEYITIASTGDAKDFGDLVQGRSQSGAFASPTRAVHIGGYGGPSVGNVNTIDYVTIQTMGNSIDFGDLKDGIRTGARGCSNATRGVFGGGYNPTPYASDLDYVTIASTGNSQDFGNLSMGNRYGSSCSSLTRGIFFIGESTSPTPGNRQNIDYVELATLANANDFGDLINSYSGYVASACSNGHGGLG